MILIVIVSLLLLKSPFLKFFFFPCRRRQLKESIYGDKLQQYNTGGGVAAAGNHLQALSTITEFICVLSKLVLRSDPEA